MGFEDCVEMEVEDFVFYVVIIIVLCFGYFIFVLQMVKYLFFFGMKVLCFNMGINYLSVECYFEEKFGEVKIVFRFLCKENEFVFLGKCFEEYFDWI